MGSECAGLQVLALKSPRADVANSKMNNHLDSLHVNSASLQRKLHQDSPLPPTSVHTMSGHIKLHVDLYSSLLIHSEGRLG